MISQGRCTIGIFTRGQSLYLVITHNKQVFVKTPIPNTKGWIILLPLFYGNLLGVCQCHNIVVLEDILTILEILYIMALFIFISMFS